MRSSSLWSIVLFGLLALAPQPANAQVTNADYTRIVRSYLARPNVDSMLGRDAASLRIEDVFTPDTLRVGETGMFSVDLNIENAAVPIRAVWDFGDGHRADGLVTHHTYREPGQYEVRLSARNPGGKASHEIQLTVLPPDEDPTMTLESN